ncbi:hypothetical protein DSAG12_01316 [Promethearchaeum syntrophicum]|uniref:Uncharacterized protein n=1 Tax=Promethearchaeum syntrophicum TaxID=2594042 RepID=A0A5B9D9S0_9ARCH|nr:hypothetical protein [Candidatus Prometheoarchaeum syntrophicum]QEE15490.1 hypothetical protein DSAG12_01316 [Candidatus Prometheoarchaeum syntrophicum]
MKHKTLKFYLQIGFCFLIFSNFTVLATSHSPQDLILSYDTENKTLTAAFKHSVSDPSSHFIETVVIKLNGTTLETLTYSSQPTNNEFSYEYNISASEGDEIFVSGTCNQGGTITQTLIIVNDLEDDPTIPSFPLSNIITSSMGTIIIVLLIIKKKGK